MERVSLTTSSAPGLMLLLTLALVHGELTWVPQSDMPKQLRKNLHRQNSVVTPRLRNLRPCHVSISNLSSTVHTMHPSLLRLLN